MKKVHKNNFVVVANTPNCKSLVFKSQLFNNSELRVFVNRKIYWFIATDVAKILEYKPKLFLKHKCFKNVCSHQELNLGNQLIRLM